MVMVAFPITAPEGSVTDPEIAPDWALCETATAVKSIEVNSSITDRARILIIFNPPKMIFLNPQNQSHNLKNQSSTWGGSHQEEATTSPELAPPSGNVMALHSIWTVCGTRVTSSGREARQGGRRP